MRRSCPIMPPRISLLIPLLTLSTFLPVDPLVAKDGSVASPPERAFETVDRWVEKIKWRPLPKVTAEDKTALKTALTTIVTAIDAEDGAFAGLDPAARSFAGRTLRNLTAMVEIIYWGAKSRGPDKAPGDMMKYAKTREPAMSDTLVWLAKERCETEAVKAR